MSGGHRVGPPHCPRYAHREQQAFRNLSGVAIRDSAVDFAETETADFSQLQCELVETAHAVPSRNRLIYEQPWRQLSVEAVTVSCHCRQEINTKSIVDGGYEVLQLLVEGLG